VTTVQRMTWRTGIPLVVACIVVGFLVGQLIELVVS
jgi:hypothetical protein